MKSFWYNARTIAYLSIAFAVMGASIALAYLGWMISMQLVLGLWLAWAMGAWFGHAIGARVRRTEDDCLEETEQDLVVTLPNGITADEMLAGFHLAVQGITERAIDHNEGRCCYCGSTFQGLLDHPYKAEYHAPGCLIPKARILADVEIGA